MRAAVVAVYVIIAGLMVAGGSGTAFADVDVPLSYMEEFYNLRLHVAFVLERLRRKLSEPATRLRDAA